jgi:hypothetical protein
MELKLSSEKLKTTKPGHVYIDRSGILQLYLGKGTLVQTATLATYTGHVHVELPNITKFRDGHVQKIRLDPVASNVQGRANVIIGRYSVVDNSIRLNSNHTCPEFAGSIGLSKMYVNIMLTKHPATRVRDLGPMPGFTPGEQTLLVTGDDEVLEYSDKTGVLATTKTGDAAPFLFMPAQTKRRKRDGHVHN